MLKIITYGAIIGNYFYFKITMEENKAWVYMTLLWTILQVE